MNAATVFPYAEFDFHEKKLQKARFVFSSNLFSPYITKLAFSSSFPPFLLAFLCQTEVCELDGRGIGVRVFRLEINPSFLPLPRFFFFFCPGLLYKKKSPIYQYNDV